MSSFSVESTPALAMNMVSGPSQRAASGSAGGIPHLAGELPLAQQRCLDPLRDGVLMAMLFFTTN